jgi:hypothetical protein
MPPGTAMSATAIDSAWVSAGPSPNTSIQTESSM